MKFLNINPLNFHLYGTSLIFGQDASNEIAANLFVCFFQLCLFLAPTTLNRKLKFFFLLGYCNGLTRVAAGEKKYRVKHFTWTSSIIGVNWLATYKF